MAMVAPASSNPDFVRENPPTGMSMARIFRIVDMGSHMHKGFQGAPDKIRRDIRIDWELPLDLLTQGELAGKPFCVGETFGFSVNEKASLRKKVLNQLVPGMDDAKAKGYDVTKLLGLECLVNIVETAPNHEGKTYFNITAVTPLMRGQAIPADAPANPKVVFDLYDYLDGNTEAFDKLPKWLQEKVLASKEVKLPAAVGSDIPF